MIARGTKIMSFDWSEFGVYQQNPPISTLVKTACRWTVLQHAPPPGCGNALTVPTAPGIIPDIHTISHSVGVA